ncbi:response regulator [Yoonia sp. 2307UL14-13]|uniref:response regulator n=1 Tax=Yoonia sp. 2307UL14-13 TaxID=3126506 RepID=UPI003095724B
MLPQNVLIVEDDVLVALDAEHLLERLGIRQTRRAVRLTEALEVLRMQAFDFGILDVNLGGETVFPVADAMIARGIPFVFASGYGRLPAMASRFAHVPLLAKPYDGDLLRDAMLAEDRR